MLNPTVDGVLGGLVAALIVYFLIQNLRQYHLTDDSDAGRSQNWLLVAGILGGVMLFVYLLIVMA